MSLVIDEIYLPATLTASPMTDEEFVQFCAKFPDCFVEMSAEGEIQIMPPNFSRTSARNAKISAQLANWAETDGRGVVTDSCGGFVLPSGARRAPDAAWSFASRVENVGEREFFHFCPDFVIELRSPSDRLPKLRAKMQEWIDNGAQLGWLIDSERRAVEIYRPGREPELRVDVSSIEGEGPVSGFVLNLEPVWNPIRL